MAIYIPPIIGYKPFYIQRDIDAAAVNIQTAYGVTVIVDEYPTKRKVKEPYKVSWKDRHGDDEYCDYLFYEAITLTLRCAIFTREADSETSRTEIMNQITNFENAIAQGEFKTWDDWAKKGFQNVRISEFEQISDGNFSNWDGRCRLVFSMKLKVNDPITRMTMYNGSIVEDV